MLAVGKMGKPSVARGMAVVLMVDACPFLVTS